MHAVRASCGSVVWRCVGSVADHAPSRLRAVLALAEVQHGMAARLFFTIWVATIHASSELDELLVMATVQNDPDAVGEFLEAGVGADAISERGVTVLMLASMMGHTEVAKHLLGRGATTEAADDLGNRALMLAASASYSTPVSYQTNLMVADEANYSFGDFAKFGLPLQLVCMLATVPACWLLS